MQTQVYAKEAVNGAHDALFGLSAAVIESIMAHAKAHQPTPPAAARRGSMLADAQAAVLKGEAPPPLTFKSNANPSYQKHADALYEHACDGNLEALTAYPIKGTNTYARALAKYRELLVTTVQAALSAGALPPSTADAL